MTIIKNGFCPNCKKSAPLLLSNNPLVPSYCADCLNKMVNRKSLKQVAYWARTYNIPLVAERWIAIEEGEGANVFATYLSVIKEEYPDTQYNNALKLADYWDDVDMEWAKVRTHKEAIKDLAPIKEDFLIQMQIKWGGRFTFEQYLQLENLYTNTIRASGITDPLKRDMIKKIAIISVDMETALANNDIKSAKEYTTMHKTYASTLGLDDLVEMTDGDVIDTVSKLAEYLEDNGFQFEYYDGVTRDIVDKTIADQQDWVRTFVQTSTGIQQTYDIVEKAYRSKLELEATSDAERDLSIEDLLDQYKSGVNADLDSALDKEKVDESLLEDF